MISKKFAIKTPRKGRFGKLVAHLLDPQGKEHELGLAQDNHEKWGRPREAATSVPAKTPAQTGEHVV